MCLVDVDFRCPFPFSFAAALCSLLSTLCLLPSALCALTLCTLRLAIAISIVRGRVSQQLSTYVLAVERDFVGHSEFAIETTLSEISKKSLRSYSSMTGLVEA